MMDKWHDYIYGKPTEAELQQVRQELGCSNCEEERGSGACYNHILIWAMDSIRGSKERVN